MEYGSIGMMGFGTDVPQHPVVPSPRYSNRFPPVWLWPKLAPGVQVTLLEHRNRPDRRAVAPGQPQREADEREPLGQAVQVGKPLDDHDLHPLFQ